MKRSDLRAGTLLHITRAASVQFHQPIAFRLIRVMEDWSSTAFDGWLWIEGYQLNHQGEAIRKRALFVMLAGLRVLTSGPAAPNARKAVAGTRRP